MCYAQFLNHINSTSISREFTLMCSSQVSNLWPLFSTQRLVTNLGFPPWMPLSQNPFLPSPGWLADSWFDTSGASWVKFKTGPHMWRARTDQRKRQTIIDWQIGGSKQGNLLMRLALGNRKIRFLHSPARIKSLYRGPNEIQSCIQLVSTPYSFKAVPLSAS